MVDIQIKIPERVLLFFSLVKLVYHQFCCLLEIDILSKELLRVCQGNPDEAADEDVC